MSNNKWLENTSPPIPENEELRQEELYRYLPVVMDQAYVKPLKNIAQLAAEICDLPVSFVNLIDVDREVNVAGYGIVGAEKARSESFCQFTITQDEVFEINDTLEDPVFRYNPHINGELKIRFYAGTPLKTQNGYNIGTLCVIGQNPNQLTASQKRALQTLAHDVVAWFDLIHANQSLKQWNQEKNELIQIVSHDMRNPLMGIIGFAGYLIQESDDDEKREIVGIIEDAGKHLLGIVNTLLKSRYIKNENFTLNRKFDDVAAATREIIVLHWASAEIKEQTLLSEIPDELVFKLDIERWKRIVGNLIGNAIKFTPKKGQIELFLSVSDDKPRILKLRVRDTGIGMPEEMCKSLFTGEKWLNRKGTEGEMSGGLGISIIQKCVELHCGQISVESEVGRGTTFDIEIPE